jgi:hypothetical protein
LKAEPEKKEEEAEPKPRDEGVVANMTSNSAKSPPKDHKPETGVPVCTDTSKGVCSSGEAPLVTPT